MVHLHYILLWHSEVLISHSFAKNKKTTVLLMRRGIQICKNFSAVLSALRTIIDWIFYKLDDRRIFWSYSSSSSCQSIIAPVGTRRSQGRAKSRNTFIDNWVCDQIIRGSRVGWFKTRADFLLCSIGLATKIDKNSTSKKETYIYIFLWKDLISISVYVAMIMPP